MDNQSPDPTSEMPSIRLFGVGDAGLNVLELLIQSGLSPDRCVAVNTGGAALEASAAAHRVGLETKRLRGLGSGGDPERSRQAAEERAEELRCLCEGVDVVFVIAGLGGGSGTGITPVLAKVAKSAGALVLAFVSTPFDCEGTLRGLLAREGLDELREAADGLICLPNQNIFKLIQENTTVLETFKIANRLLADGVTGVWRLVSFRGLIAIHFEDLLHLIQNRHCKSTFAVAEASGETRSQVVLEKLLVHPLLESGEVLSDCDAILVSLTGGPSLTMAEINRLIEEIKAKCGKAQLIVGACVDESFGERLAVTLIAVNRPDQATQAPSRREELGAQLLDREASAKPSSRFLPPPPALGPDQVKEFLNRRGTSRGVPRRNASKMRQGQLPLDIISKGRFDKSEPTIYKGEDLDVPTYIRRGVPLN
jgi:cell division protein FtsZ